MADANSVKSFEETTGLPNPFISDGRDSPELWPPELPNPFTNTPDGIKIENAGKQPPVAVRDEAGTVIGKNTVKEAPGGVSKALSEAARLGWITVTEAAAAVNRGIIYTADIPPSIVNGVSEMLGGPKLSSQITDLAFVQKATDTERELDSFAARTARDSVEFFAGGGVFAGIAKSALAVRQSASNLKTTGTLILESLARYSPKMEALVSTGGALGNQTTALATDDPYWKLAGTLFGGATVGGFASLGNVAQRAATKHAKAVLEEALADPKQADFNLEQANDRTAPVESMNDIGANSIFHKLMRKYMVLQNDYHNYQTRQQAYLESEMEDMLLLADDGISEGLFQDYISKHKDFHLATQEMIVKQAEDEILEVQALNGRSTDRVEFSMAGEERLQVARDDIADFRRKLWRSTESAGVAVSSDTNNVVETANNIVLDFAKNYNPPAELATQIQYATSKRLVKTNEGWTLDPLTPKEIKDGVFPQLREFEAVNALQKSRSVWEGAKRKFKSGDNADLVASRYFSMLSASAMDSLTNVTMVGEGYSTSLQTALEFTRREKQLLSSGRFGKGAVLDKTGVERISPEEYAPNFFGNSEFTGATAGRNLDELQTMHREATPDFVGPTNTLRPFADYILATGQKELKKGQKQIDAFVEDHNTMLNRFPDVKKELLDARDKVLLSTNKITKAELEIQRINADPVYQFIGIPGKNVAGVLLNNSNVSRVVDRVLEITEGNTAVRTDLKRDVVQLFLRSAVPGGYVARPRTISEAFSDKKELFRSKLFSEQEQTFLAKSVNELSNRADIVYHGSAGNTPPVKASLFRRLGGRLLASHLVSGITHGAGSIIIAASAARAGEDILATAPTRAVERVLAEALMDSTKMKKLRAATTQQAQDKEFINLVRTFSPGVAHDLDTKYEALYESSEEEEEVSKPRTDYVTSIKKIMSRNIGP